MNSRTYYDILGVSREATLQEITSAKNALAKVYHPDANMNQGIDTTACMQEILEAYRVLSNPESRHEYDKELGGGQIRVFRTFTVGPEDDEQAAPFVVYWNAACRLQETVDLAMEFLENNSQKKKRTFLFFRRKDAASEAEKQKHLNKLSVRAMQYITVLKEAGIPSQYWTEDAMNWVLIRWSHRQNMDYRVLFNRYEKHLNQDLSNSERHKLHVHGKQFHNNLKNCSAALYRRSRQSCSKASQPSFTSSYVLSKFPVYHGSAISCPVRSVKSSSFDTFPSVSLPRIRIIFRIFMESIPIK